MIIVGAKGFAKEILEVFSQKMNLEGIAFFDNINMDLGDKLYKRFPILKSYDEVEEYFKNHGNEFTLGIGGPEVRLTMTNKFLELGGKLTSVISPRAEIGSFGCSIGDGVSIMTNTVITNDVKVGKGSLINLSCTVGHDTRIGEFAELCPDVNISGNCNIGDLTFVGTNAVVLPNVSIGNNVIIGAGSVVTKDIPSNSVALGIPAKVIKENK